ncbi:MAG: hypothetical protein V7K89_11750 [Nostoc sp.]|uniref:hypothetical protein n=1 Tax=Nostoc sp. TaxID=1180 RepID=UPI002FFA889A
MKQTADVAANKLMGFCSNHVLYDLHWTLPHFSTPEQSERWSDLMLLVSWQLWLAKDGIRDCPLPWQKPCQNLSFGQVA